MVAGDTQVVYGPHVFSTPNGRPTNYVEALSLVVQPTRRYTLRLVNGAATGPPDATVTTTSSGAPVLRTRPPTSAPTTSEPAPSDSSVTGQLLARLNPFRTGGGK